MNQSFPCTVMAFTTIGSNGRTSRSSSILSGVYSSRMMKSDTSTSATRSTYLIRRSLSSGPSDSPSVDDMDEDFSEQGYTATTTATAETRGARTSIDEEMNNRDGLMNKLFNLFPSTHAFFVNNPSDDTAEETRRTINEMIVRLEKSIDATTTASSTTTNPTSSPLLNGVWELRYVGGYTPTPFAISPTRQLALFLYSGGYSPGVRVFIALLFSFFIRTIYEQYGTTSQVLYFSSPFL
jgi:hypothetical protein